MSNMFVLKINIFEAQTGVVNLFCKTTQSRHCSFSMYCSFFNNSFLLVYFLIFSALIFQHSTSSSEAGLISDSSILGPKTSIFSHARLCPSNSFFSLSSLTFLHVFLASTLTLAKPCPIMGT